MNSEPDANADNAVAKPVTRTKIGWLWLVVAAIGFVCYALFNRQVFPAASINYSLTSQQAAISSRQLATELGYDVNKNIQTTVFINDDDAKTVLEFKLGVKAANELMKDKVPVWLWRTRFCKELSKEQMYIAYTTSGQLKSVFHLFENDLKFPSLSKEAAQQLAQDFIAKTGKQDLSKYELFDYGTEAKPNRTDQHFEWRKSGYPESTLRIRVDIAGDKLSSYRYYLAPSDTWTREYKKIRENNELLGKIASFFIFAFIVTTIGAFVYGLNTHNIRWRFAFTCSAILVLLFILDQGNNWTNTIDSQYETSQTFANFVTKQLMSTLFMAVGAFLMSMTLVGGAEIIYRRSWPAHMAMPYLLTLRGMSKPDFFQKTLRGYLVVGGMMLWVISYYMIGQKFNFFCPLGVDDYKTLGTYCPAVSGALIGVSAAGLEEFTCRVVALGLLKKWLKSFWLANIIQAVVWGFAHSQYPQQPSYARGIELSVVGLVFGWIINRYGILPCFVAHYLYDAFLTVEPVFATGQLSLTIPAIICLVPFLAGALYSSRWAKRHVLPEADLSNAASQHETVPKERKEIEIDRSETTYTALSQRWRIGLVLTALLCLGVTFIPSPDAVGSAKKVLIRSDQALAVAKKYLHEDASVDDKYQSQTELLCKPDQSDMERWQYIFEQIGKQKTADLYAPLEPCLEWRVRFYKPGDSKIYWVFMNGDGSKRATIFEDIDDGKGAKLTESEALAIVERYIKKNRPEFLPYEVIGENKVERPDRTDYEFELGVPRFNVGATPAKLKAGVKGDQLSELRVDWDIPDSWLWPRNKLKWYQQLNAILRNISGIVLVVAFLSWGIFVLRATSIRWAGPLLLSGIGSVVAIVATFNVSSKLFSTYNTAESLQSFIAQSVAQESLKVLLLGGAYLLLSLAGFATIRLCFPALANQLRHSFLLKPHDARERLMRSNIWLDGAISSYTLCAVLAAFKFIHAAVMEPLSPSVHLDIPKFMPAIFSSLSPQMDVITSLVSSMILGLMIASLAAGIWQKFLRQKWQAGLLIIFGGILMGASSWYWQDGLAGFIFSVACMVAVWFFVTRVFRSNLLSYVFVAFEAAAGMRLSEVMQHAEAIGRVEIGIMFAFLCLPLFASIVVCIMDRSKREASTPS